MRKATLLVLTVMLVALSILVLIMLLSSMDSFRVRSVTVSGMDSIPSGVRDVLSACQGVNRFRLDEKAIERELEAQPLVDTARISYSFPADMLVTIVPSSEHCLLFDGNQYYILDESGRPLVLGASDGLDGQSGLCTLEVEPSFISYLSSYGAPASFRQVMDLVDRLWQSGGMLISRIKYDNNTLGGSGQLVLSLSPLNCELYVREPVSVDRISDSLGIIQAAVAEDPAGRIGFDCVRWDLYSNALVRRTVDRNG